MSSYMNSNFCSKSEEDPQPARDGLSIVSRSTGQSTRIGDSLQTGQPSRHWIRRNSIVTRHWLRRNSIVTLLVFACLTMCVVAFEQNRTISLQRELIKSLFRDSIELNAMKMHALDSGAQPSPQQATPQRLDSTRPQPPASPPPHSESSPSQPTQPESQ